MTAALAPDSAALADAAHAWSTAYVHVPFCARVCPYCDFAVSVGSDHLAGRFVDAVVAEIEAAPAWPALDAVYLGGGTPSRLSAEQAARILRALRSRPGLAADAQVSLEANPEDWIPAHSAALRSAGFNRVSLGAQSFDDDVLRRLGRVHSAEDTRRAVAASRIAGYASVNLDLIFGTAGETLESWRATLEEALLLQPDHVSCYALTVELGTRLGREVAAGAAAPDPDLQADMYELAVELLGAAGMVRYEVSNWARPGHECRYNLAVWAGAEYLAFGPAAHRHIGGIRSRNLRRLSDYLEEVEAGRSPARGDEHLDGWGAEVERVFLGLRRTAGVEAGRAGLALAGSAEGRRLLDAGVLAVEGERLVVRRPLLTDAAERALLSLSPADR